MSLLGPLAAMYEWSNAPEAASRQIKVTFSSQYFRNMKNKLRHLAAEMITESNDCVLVKCNMEEIDTGAFEKSHLWVLCRALWSLKTMGDGVCIGATLEWSLVSNGGNTRNDLQPQFSRMTHSTQCHLVSGLGFKGSSIDVCGRSMNHFNGCFPPWSTWPPPKCSRISRQAGWTNCTKSSDGKNWSHLQIVPLSLSRAKKPWEMLGWPLTVGQFVKQRDFGRAQRAVDEGGKPISTICKSIPESSSIISASSLLHHVASFSKIKIET